MTIQDSQNGQSAHSESVISTISPKSRKVLIKRQGTTGGKLPWLSWKNSHTWRHLSQSLFILINSYIGITFYFWVRYYESGGSIPYVERPSGIEGWLPIAGLMNLKYSLLTHQLPPIYGAAMLLLVAFLFISAVFKKSFCSWLCPIGTLSEILWRFGEKVFRRRLRLTKWLDIPLRAMKYLVLALIFYFLIPMSATEIVYFLTSPYGIIIDVKMLDFFRNIGQTTLIVVAILTISSLFIQNTWCRYFCPYGALIGLVSLFSPFKIRRDTSACIDCNRCAQACPSRLPVDKLINVRSIECTTCLSCVEVCPAQDALQLSLRPSKIIAENGDTAAIEARWRGRKILGVSVALFIYLSVFAVIGFAKYAKRWDSPVPVEYYYFYIPKMTNMGHP
jgi:polyferredoxin